MAFKHGITLIEISDGARTLTAVSTAIIGLAATASDADAATFPLNRPALITDVEAAIGKAGVDGTLAIALRAIADHIGIRKRQAEAGANRAPLERKAADLKSKITRLVDAIANGAGELHEVKDRLRTARADLAEVQRQLASMDEAVPLELSSELADRYRLYIAKLDTPLQPREPPGNAQHPPYAN